MVEPRLNVGFWFYRVLTWDALVPLVLLLVPMLVAQLSPHNLQANPRNFGPIEMTAVLLPVFAFLVRAMVGTRHIASNHCHDWLKAIQFFTFFTGILCLILIDSLLILLPARELFRTPVDTFLFTLISLFYLTMMVIAMYPGHTFVEVTGQGEDESARL